MNFIKSLIYSDKKAIILLNYIVAILLLFCLFYFSFMQLQYNFNWNAIYNYKQKFINGFLTTILISIFALIFSFIIALIFAICQRSKFLLLKSIARIYVEVIRGTPLLVQILIFFYVIADSFNIQNRYIVGIFIMSFFSGAYVTEIIRAGFESISKSQLESIKAVGFSTYQKYRYIIFPQMFKKILPPLAGQFASLIKDSSLLSIISISEFTLNAQEVNAFTYSTLESYIPLAIGYLALTLPISIISKNLERKFSYDT